LELKYSSHESTRPPILHFGILTCSTSYRQSSSKSTLFISTCDYDFLIQRETVRSIGSRAPMTARRQALSHVPCRYFHSSKGYFISSSTFMLIRFSCYRGDECWFLHDIPAPETLLNTSTALADELPSPHSETSSSSPAELRTESTPICGICFETPKKYGLLANCSHTFCLCSPVYCVLLTTSLYSQMEKQRRKVGRGIIRRVHPTVTV
jgi:hypothetical protein